MKTSFISIALVAALLGFAPYAKAQSNVRMNNLFQLTTDLEVPTGKTLTISGTVTGSGPIGTTGTMSSGSFSTGALTTTGSLTVSGSFTVSGSSTTATLSAVSLSATTASVSTGTVSGTFRALSPTAGIGYGTGAGGTVVQSTSKSAAVTLNTVVGQITLNSFSLSSATNVSFTLTNSAIAANDVLIPAVSSGGTQGAYQVWVSTIGTGSASFTVRNATAATLSESPVISYIVIKGSAN